MPLLSVIIPTYRNGAQTVQTLDALRACRLPAGVGMEVVVVDDASGDGSASLLANYRPSGDHASVRLLVNACNAGRAATRNVGARAATGEYLLFLDADCVPADADFLLAHCAVMQASDVSMGVVQGNTRDFWHDYHHAASRRREVRTAKHPELLLTSANVMVRRDVFLAAGGFDERYRGYGFEDRALAMVLLRHGARLAVCGEARARHEDRLTLEMVCAKLHEAAGENGGLFCSEFPVAYRVLGYASIDARLHAWLRWPSRLAEPLRRALIAWLSPRLETSTLPLWVRLRTVRWLCAASYLRGSSLAAARKSA